jgi:hypothetical protein
LKSGTGAEAPMLGRLYRNTNLHLLQTPERFALNL